MAKSLHYFITTLTGTGATSKSRCVGYTGEHATADAALRLNAGDLHEEGYYPLAVIEAIPEGIYQHAHTDGEDIWWYAWNEQERGFRPCERPKEYAHTCGIGIG